MRINLTENTGLRPDEALMVENAIRLAIDSVLNVLCGVNSGRCREYQQMVADRDKEIHRLQREMSALRRRGCASCGQLNRGTPERSPGSGNAERDAEQQQPPQCELGYSLSLFDGPPSHAPVPTLPSLPCSQADASAASGTGVAVKDEPCNVDAVLVKWEPSEGSSRERQNQPSGPCWDAELELREVMTCEEADKLPNNTEAERLRSKKKRVPTADLADEAQQQKRAAWRAASRRYYARKVARQMAGFHHQPPSRYPSPRYDGARRRRPAGASPPDTRPWSAPSRKFYHTRKTTNQNQYREPELEPTGDDGGGLEEFL
ncbi:uncharacterized protein LOC130914240 [Corythoichthys intestinalis]|uniref:uncharacterized protein LOC130914240 n=1 Tax=Corythoichthys intestinalis TaxID=161448 RepID=UPI0025A59CD7|nr:uncharacterized protein LOC130914240 [Corythoichthys intestinalis]